MAPGRDIFHESLDFLKAVFFVRHFAAAELQRDLDLHVFGQESDGVIELHTEIVRVDARAKLNLFNFRGVLAFLGFFFLLRLLVTELAVVNEAADWRIRGGRDLDEVDCFGPRPVERLLQGQDAELRAIHADYAHFASTDFPVHFGKRAARR